MNAMQKVGVFGAISLIAIIIVLHGPWTGYTTTGRVSVFGETTFYELNFASWSTRAPALPWFGNVLNAIAALVLVAIVALAWLWLHSSPKVDKSEPEQR